MDTTRMRQWIAIGVSLLVVACAVWWYESDESRIRANCSLLADTLTKSADAGKLAFVGKTRSLDLLVHQDVVIKMRLRRLPAGTGIRSTVGDEVGSDAGGDRGSADGSVDQSGETRHQHVIEGLQQLKALFLQAWRRFGNFTIALADVQVTVTDDGQSATALLTASVSRETHEGTEQFAPQEIRCHWRMTDGEWFLTAAEQVQVFRR